MFAQIMVSSLKSRWLRLRNFQSQDFWAMVFARPLTILLLLGIADLRWVTPNRITVLAVLAKLAGVAFLVFDLSFGGGVAAAVLLNLGLVLDNMDGTLARYRRSGTTFGYYLDKVSDAVTLGLMFWAIGYRTYLGTSETVDLVLPAMGLGGAMVAGYAMWVADRVQTDIRLARLVAKPDELERWARERTTPDGGTPPPERTMTDWLKWLGRALASILFLNEVDIFFWVAVALLTEKLWIFTRVLCPLYALALLGGPLLFTLKIRRTERT